MWPWGHFGVAYLCYTLYARKRLDRLPDALPVLALAAGSQLPDLVDKPLAWTFDVLPGGRTLAHSLLFAVAVLPSVYWLARRVDRPDAAVAFAVGHLSHLVADVPPSVLRGGGELPTTAYLLWPLLEAPPEEPVAGLLDAILTYYALGSYEWLQVGLFALAVVAWYRDGAPGLARVRQFAVRGRAVLH